MGWSYEDWRGPFYEAGLPAAKMLEQYARVFSTVELDTTFYGFPRPSTLDGWGAQVPADFLFSAKVPRSVTHERRLFGASEIANDFGRLLHDRLDKRLGALLLQLPPDFTANDRGALDEFVEGIASPRNGPPLPWVIEFRHASWKDADVLPFLDAHGVAVATTEKLDLGGPLRYVRLLGTENSVARFDTRQMDRGDDLAIWAARLDAARRDAGNGGAYADRPLLVYVRNFFEGHAPATIADLRERLGLPNALPPGQEQMSLF